ncbi:hypothetical protein FCM35_KLT20988 [Carex littledalei]|uniref:Uncharacterized protein n=1 Tax=Carex littledalei TaxID=544730 RepID=A0A833RFG3_9POAL|nr:hypothetical protein FCM35_KLT20988 [Carex littledalei]
MLRPPLLASSSDNRFLLRTTSSFNPSNRLPRPLSDNFNLPLKPQTNHRFLPSLSVASRRFSFPLAYCTRTSRRSDELVTVKEVTDEGERAEEVVGVSNVDGNLGFMRVGVGNPSLVGRVGLIRMSLGDQAFFLMAFVAVTTSIAFTSLVAVAIPTLFALKRTAKSLAKLADTACVELPSTMAAIRLSGLEISDLTLELSDLSQGIAGSVSKSTQAVKAAGAGIKQIGAVAQQKTMSIIEERANLPEMPIEPFVAGAARKTSHAFRQVANNLMSFISGNVESSRKQKPSNSLSREGKSSIRSSKKEKPKPKPSTIVES